MTPDPSLASGPKRRQIKTKKASQPNVIFKWVDPETKEVRVPADLSAALKKDKKAAVFYEGLSFTNKKEYIEWIVTAKKDDTRKKRINGMLERLNKEWKNPGNMR